MEEKNTVVETELLEEIPEEVMAYEAAGVSVGKVLLVIFGVGLAAYGAVRGARKLKQWHDQKKAVAEKQDVIDGEMEEVSIDEESD